MKKKIHPFFKGLIAVAITAALFTMIYLLDIRAKILKQENAREPISQVDYSQQLEMKEYHQSQDKHNLIYFEFDNDMVKFIY